MTRDRYRGQARCAVSRVGAFLNRLRALGVYDSSLIVISSDHGIGLQPRQFVARSPRSGWRLSVIAGKAMALLVVKPPSARDPCASRQAPTAITDIPVTVADALGVPHKLPGEPALKLAEKAAAVRTFGSTRGSTKTGRRATSSTGPPGNQRATARRRFVDAADSLYGPERRTRCALAACMSRSAARRASCTDGAGRTRSSTRRKRARGSKSRFDRSRHSRRRSHSRRDRVLANITLSDQRWVTLRHRLQPAADPSGQWVQMDVEPSWRPRGDGRRLGVMTRDVKWTP